MTDPRAEAERLLKIQSDEYALWTEDEQTQLGVAVRGLLDQIATLEAAMTEHKGVELAAIERARKAEATVATLTAERDETHRQCEAFQSALRSSLGQIRDEMVLEEEGYWAEQIDALLNGEK